MAGPSVGFTLWQIYLHISSFVNFNRDQFNRKYEFGIRWNNGCTNLRIFGNHIKNATGNDSIDSTNPKSPSNVKIWDNKGYITNNEGAITFDGTGSQSAFDIAHGLDVKPTVALFHTTKTKQREYLL